MHLVYVEKIGEAGDETVNVLYLNTENGRLTYLGFCAKLGTGHPFYHHPTQEWILSQ